MAKIVATLRILPKEVETNLEQLRRDLCNSLPNDTFVHSFDEEPIAFGLVALIAHIVLPDDEGGVMDRVETSVRSLESVSQVEVVMVRRV